MTEKEIHIGGGGGGGNPVTRVSDMSGGRVDLIL